MENSIEMINSVLNSFRDEMAEEYSDISKLIRLLSEMEVNSENSYIFITIFRDVYDGEYSLNDVTEYLNKNSLPYSMNSLFTFLTDYKNSIKVQRESFIYKKILYGTTSSGNGVLLNFITELYDKTSSISYKNIFFKQNTNTLNNITHWLVKPILSYFDKSNSFRNIREAELEYHRKFKEYLETADKKGKVSIGIDSLDLILEAERAFSEDFFIIKRPEAYFLEKPGSKSLFTRNSLINNEILFACSRYYKDKDGKGAFIKGITLKDFFLFFSDFISEFTESLKNNENSKDWLTTDKIIEADITNFIKKKFEDFGTIKDSKGLKRFIFYYIFKLFYNIADIDIEKLIENSFSKYQKFGETIDNFLNELILNKSFKREG